MKQVTWRRIFRGFAITVVILFSACGKDEMTEPNPDQEETRSFALGFTDFPHAFSLDAVAAAYSVIEKDGDLVCMHFDSGVPWDEALQDLPYPQNYIDEINGKVNAIPDNHMAYLAVTPIAYSRDQLAEYRGNAGTEALQPPWKGRSFDHPDVITAFANHCQQLISIFSPDYFALAIEANLLIDLNPSEWGAFVTLAESVYAEVKSSRNELPVMITLQAESFHSNLDEQEILLPQILPFSDFIAVSSYPYTLQFDPQAIPDDYFSVLADLAPEKPFAIAETAWPAEDISDPYPVFIPGSEQFQANYMKRLLDDADDLSVKFVCWFFTRDFDDFWETQFQFDDRSPIIRLWKDTGLYDGDGNSRDALEIWKEYLTLNLN